VGRRAGDPAARERVCARHRRLAVGRTTSHDPRRGVDRARCGCYATGTPSKTAARTPR
jgi:hypothetical protein